MLKLTPNPTFVADVPITVPGAPEPVNISITFRHRNKDSFKAWWESTPGKSDAENLAAVIESWDGPADEQGNPAPYSRKALEKLLDEYPASALEILRAYQRELFESRIKN